MLRMISIIYFIGSLLLLNEQCTAITHQSNASPRRLQINDLDTVSFTVEPTLEPTPHPTPQPTLRPSFGPTIHPSIPPTHYPTSNPTTTPTARPTDAPTTEPTPKPTPDPTLAPSVSPTPHSMANTNRYTEGNETANDGNVKIIERVMNEKDDYTIAAVIAIILALCIVCCGIVLWYCYLMKSNETKPFEPGQRSTMSSNETESISIEAESIL